MSFLDGRFFNSVVLGFLIVGIIILAFFVYYTWDVRKNAASFISPSWLPTTMLWTSVVLLVIAILISFVFLYRVWRGPNTRPIFYNARKIISEKAGEFGEKVSRVANKVGRVASRAAEKGSDRLLVNINGENLELRRIEGGLYGNVNRDSQGNLQPSTRFFRCNSGQCTNDVGEEYRNERLKKLKYFDEPRYNRVISEELRNELE